MDQRQARAREIQRQIGDVLLRDWDPLGLNGSSDTPDVDREYDAYVGGVYRLLSSGASAGDIAEHLARTEADALGYADTDPKMLIPLANKLIRLNVRLSSDGSSTEES